MYFNLVECLLNFLQLHIKNCGPSRKNEWMMRFDLGSFFRYSINLSLQTRLRRYYYYYEYHFLVPIIVPVTYSLANLVGDA